MRNFEKTLGIILAEDDFDLLPEKQKRAVKTAKKLGTDKLDDREQDEIEHEYYAGDSD
jgi:hypothetical protein